MDTHLSMVSPKPVTLTTIVRAVKYYTEVFSIADKEEARFFLVWLLKHSFAPGALAIFQYLGLDDRSLSNPINFYQFMVTTVGKHLSRAFNAGISRMTDSYFRPPFHRATLQKFALVDWLAVTTAEEDGAGFQALKHFRTYPESWIRPRI